MLGDDPKVPRFIETRHRRGYRFVPTLTDKAEDMPAPSALRESAEPRSSVEPVAIAVLPFADMSPGRDQDYLCEGLAEELINALVKVEGLRVVSRTASFQFRSMGADISEVGRQLGIGTLVEGSVRRAEDRLRVTVQLIEVATGFHRWSQRFDRRLDDVFAIQDEIAEAVATSMRGGVLSPLERRTLARPQTSVEPYEHYLRARQHLLRLTKPDAEASIPLFEQAVALDPNYAPALAGLATAHSTMCEWFGGGESHLRAAERASRRALELAPELAEAHVARGSALAMARDYAGAGEAYERAIAINPNLFEAYYFYARAAFASGQIEKSVTLFRQAGDVRQEDFQSVLFLAQSLRMLGRREEARAPANEAFRRAERVLSLNPGDRRALSLGAAALFHGGQPELALEWCQRALALHPDDTSVLINAACLLLKLQRNEEALDVLERVFGQGHGKRDWVEHDPDYDSVRDHPRFVRLLARLR